MAGNAGDDQCGGVQALSEVAGIRQLNDCREAGSPRRHESIKAAPLRMLFKRKRENAQPTLRISPLKPKKIARSSKKLGTMRSMKITRRSGTPAGGS